MLICRWKFKVSKAIIEAETKVRNAGYGIDMNFDKDMIKIEGYAPMSYDELVGFAKNLRGQKPVLDGGVSR